MLRQIFFVNTLMVILGGPSDTEDRFITIGPIGRAIVVVVYSEREEERIRIIGARFANKREQDLYAQHVDRSNE